MKTLGKQYFNTSNVNNKQAKTIQRRIGSPISIHQMLIINPFLKIRLRLRRRISIHQMLIINSKIPLYSLIKMYFNTSNVNNKLILFIKSFMEISNFNTSNVNNKLIF